MEFAKVKVNKVTINIDDQGKISYSVDVKKTANIVSKDRYGTLTEKWEREDKSYGTLKIAEIEKFMEYVRSEVESVDAD